MIGVMIIPTGIGCEIGGHAGDANPAAKLIASCCDKLIIHPNVVNASDINEMPENCLYVEGSMLDRFLDGGVSLRECKTYNRILLAVNAPVKADTINSVSAARATIGAEIKIVELSQPLVLHAFLEDGVATGHVEGIDALVSQFRKYDFDALAIQTAIKVNPDVANEYLIGFTKTNPWGGVEAICSQEISLLLDKPVAHAPLESGIFDNFSKVVDPRIAAETVSVSYLHCVLKGLHRAPTISRCHAAGIMHTDVDFMVSPAGCFGSPHQACIDSEIPIIVVAENKSVLNESLDCEHHTVANYLEAAGLIMSMKAGVSRESVTGKFRKTEIFNDSGYDA